MKCPNGSESVMSSGPWSQTVAIKHCVCSDGRPRYARITGQPDTFFSIPAAVKVKGKTVTGFVSINTSCGKDEGYIFHANQFGKNGALLP